MHRSKDRKYQHGSASGAIWGLLVFSAIFFATSHFISTAQIEKMQVLEAEVASSPSLPITMERIDRSTCGYLVPDASARIMATLVCRTCARLAAGLHEKYEITQPVKGGCTGGRFNVLVFSHKP